MRSADPGLRDDPLVQQGDAERAAQGHDGHARSRAAAGPVPKGGRRAKGAAVGPETIVIDVIVAYTKKAAGNYADIEHELVDLAIEEANKSFRMSNLGHIKLRLVHAYQTDYVEEGAHFDHVWRFADKGDGYMEEIQACATSIAPMSRSSSSTTRRAAGWPPACTPMPTRPSPWCITTARPLTYTSRTRSATSSARATSSTWTRA